MAKIKGNGQSRAMRDEKRQLPVELTESELLARGEAMSTAELRIEALKDERKDLSKLIAIEVKARADLAHTIERGTEERLVRCVWIENWSENAMKLVRQDTGEVVDVRPMSALDRQLEIEETVDDGSGVPSGASSSDPHAATKLMGAGPVVLELADSDAGDPDELHLHVRKPKRARKAAAKRKRAPKASESRKANA